MSAVDVLANLDRIVREVPMGLGHMQNMIASRAAVAELMDQRAELIARLEQVVPYLYVLENEGIDTCVPVRMKIEQAEAALERCGK